MNLTKIWYYENMNGYLMTLPSPSWLNLVGQAHYLNTGENSFQAGPFWPSRADGSPSLCC